jgi:hypothetical protein
MGTLSGSFFSGTRPVAANAGQVFRFKTGLWYPANWLNNGNPNHNNPGNQNSQYYPFQIDLPGNGFKAVGVNVFSAGNAGDKLEVGVYSDTGSGAPNLLLADWGGLSLAAAGNVSLAITWTPAPGLYWLSILQLTTGNPQLQLLSSLNLNWPYGFASQNPGTGAYGYFINGIGAFPASAAAAALNPNQGGAYSPFLQAA